MVCKVQGERELLREYIDRVFDLAEFLGYEASWQELVDRVVMKLHPFVLAHAAFLIVPVRWVSCSSLSKRRYYS
jgi:hypothetical protein